MKVDTDDVEVECDRCDALLELEDYAINLVTGELRQVHFEEVTPIRMKVVEV